MIWLGKKKREQLKETKDRDDQQALREEQDRLDQQILTLERKLSVVKRDFRGNR